MVRIKSLVLIRVEESDFESGARVEFGGWG